MNDKKKAVNMILGPRESEAGGEKSPPESDLSGVAKDLIAAVKADDVSGVESALRAAYACCDTDEPGE